MSGSMLVRSVLALLLAVGFYVLALGIAGALGLFLYAEFFIWDSFFLYPTLLAAVGFLVIVWSILPRIDFFEAPGPLLLKSE